MKTKWIILWYFGKDEENDIYLNSVHDTKEEARKYLDEIKWANGNYRKEVKFTILEIPISS